MDAIDGYRRAALSLQQLPLDEQAWILSQLDESDRLRIGQLLGTIQDSAETAETKEAAAVGDAPAKADTESDADFLGNVHFHVLASVLNEQPDWVAATVLVYSKKSSAVHMFVNQLSPDRMEHFRSLIKHARDHIKPKVREAVLHSVAAQVRAYMQKQAETMGFDSILEQAAKR